MKCKKCQKPLSGKQTVFCSQICGKLYLKSLYKKRNRDRLNAYNRNYRKRAKDAYFIRSDVGRKRIFSLMPVCQRCGTDKRLMLCHIKPHWAGGTKEIFNIFVFCQKCHHSFDNALRIFWKDKTNK